MKSVCPRCFCSNEVRSDLAPPLLSPSALPVFVLNYLFSQGWPSSLTGVFSCLVMTRASTYLGSGKRRFHDVV